MVIHPVDIIRVFLVRVPLGEVRRNAWRQCGVRKFRLCLLATLQSDSLASFTSHVPASNTIK